MNNTFTKIKQKVQEEFPKEYVCHLCFVHKVALDLQKEKGGNKEIIEIAAIAHDIGRSANKDNSDHAEIGSKKIISWLKKLNYNNEKILKISKCIFMHNKTKGFSTIEEEIISNADNLSKLLYLDMFMLMCKKDNYQDKAKWGLKYINKGYNNLTFADLKEKYYLLHKELKKRYESVTEIKCHQ